MLIDNGSDLGLGTPHGPGKSWPALTHPGGSQVLSLSVPFSFSLYPLLHVVCFSLPLVCPQSLPLFSPHGLTAPACFPFSLLSAPFLLRLCSSLLLITCVWCMCVCCWCVCVSVHLHVGGKGRCQLTPSLALRLMFFNLFYRVYLLCVCECVYV